MNDWVRGGLGCLAAIVLLLVAVWALNAIVVDFP